MDCSNFSPKIKRKGKKQRFLKEDLFLLFLFEENHNTYLILRIFFWRNSIDFSDQKIIVSCLQKFCDLFVICSWDISNFCLFEIEGNGLSIIGIFGFKDKLKLRSDFKLIKDKNSLCKRETSNVAVKKMKMFHG